MVLSIVALFITIVMRDRLSSMALLMFYGLTCLSFLGYRSYGFRSLSMYFPIDYYRFRNYRNIGTVFVSNDIVSIRFHPYNFSSDEEGSRESRLGFSGVGYVEDSHTYV